MKLFDTLGNELPLPKPDGPLEHIAEIGGQFDECSFCIEFHHKALDRHAISSTLACQPTKAWNAGEPHPIGNGRSGKLREVDYGRWYLKVEVPADGNIGDEIKRFLSDNSAPATDWQKLALAWSGRIALVGHANNWNREFNLSSEVVAMLAERGLALNIDAYFDGKSNEA